MGVEPQFNERAYRNVPWRDEQTTANRERSQTRAKVEHVFGSWVITGSGKLLRTIGMARAQTHLGLQNLVSNFKRLVFLEPRMMPAETLSVGSRHHVNKANYRIFPLDVPLALVDDNWVAHADIVIDQLIWQKGTTNLQFTVVRLYDRPFSLH
jgi:hypothetical protein